jgi:tRNA-Thr(GGU) m(6)t(6)A37 methyltransferase TsaA
MKPIGVIRTPFTQLDGMPIQPGGAAGVEGELIVEAEYGEGLSDLAGFSHLYLIYLFHEARRTQLKVVPFMDETARGVFATRSPLRPNHIGLSIVEMVSVEGCRVRVKNIDILDNTPLIDIKPYIAAFDSVEQSRSGWMDKDRTEVQAKRSDDRFI